MRKQGAVWFWTFFDITGNPMVIGIKSHIITIRSSKLEWLRWMASGSCGAFGNINAGQTVSADLMEWGVTPLFIWCCGISTPVDKRPDRQIYMMSFGVASSFMSRANLNAADNCFRCDDRPSQVPYTRTAHRAWNPQYINRDPPALTRLTPRTSFLIRRTVGADLSGRQSGANVNPALHF